MDIVTILEDAVSSLAVGDYTVGLSAIVRHVKAAIQAQAAGYRRAKVR